MDKRAFATFAEENNELATALQETDIVVINGEGTLHGIRPAPLGLLYVAYIVKTFLAKDVQIINHSVYPQDDLRTDDQEIIALYKLVYEQLDFVAIYRTFKL
jgi:hypothetical protein